MGVALLVGASCGDDDCACMTPAGGSGAGGAGTSGASGSPMGSGGIGGGGTAGAGTGGTGGTGGTTCTAPTTDCNGMCVDVKATDSANCGACGRACLGKATCAQGACVPEALTDTSEGKGEVAPYALAQDDTSLYWVSPAIKGDVAFSRMRRVAKASAGGTAQNAFASTIVRARSLGFDGTKLYWGDLGANPSDTNQKLVAGVPGGDPTTLEPDQLGIEHVTLGAGKVYWSLLSLGAVRGKQADGTGPVAPEVPFQTTPRWVVVDTDAVPYWVANAGGGQREVRRLQVSPPNTAAPVATGTDVVAVELTPERFYWADRAAGTVQSRPKATPTEAPRDEFSGQGPVEGFHVEDTTLYVLTAQGRQLKAWRKGEGDAVPLLLGEVEAKADPYFPTGNPFGAAYVLTDTQYVYFADVGTFAAPTPDFVPVSTGDGVVYRVAK
jgi:Stigma-specific protein, Stig1